MIFWINFRERALTMFTKKEISLMKRLGLKFDFNNLSDEEWGKIEDTVGDHLTLQCLEGDAYKPNAEGLTCYDILYKLP